MMVSLLGYKSPIYGRRTAQVLLEPLTFKEACEFFPKRMIKEDKVRHYAILGGTPAYLLEFDYRKAIYTNIEERILRKNTFLYQDTLFVLQQELNEPRIYYSIIQSVAKGNTRLGHISNDTGIPPAKVGKYLSVLQQLHLIERRVPITEKSKEKSKKGLYKIKDQYFKFWFKFVFGNNDYIEQNSQDLLIKEKIKPELNAFVGESYEEIVFQWVIKHDLFKGYLFGRWWDKEAEIDIVGIDRYKWKMLLGEVKWKNLTKKQVVKILGDLEIKARKVNLPMKKEYFLVAKKLSGKRSLQKEGYKVFDLDDIL